MNGLQSLVPAFKKARKKRVPKYASGGAPATTYVSNRPAFTEQPLRDVVQTAQDLITQPSVQYGGDRVAQFTDLQEQGFEGVKNLGPSAQSTAAGTMAQTVGDKALGAGAYDPATMTSTLPGGPQQTSTQSFTQPGTTDKYMNPYMQGVVDIGKREATRQDDIARTQRNAAAVGAGAFGGSRQAIVEAEAGRNLQQRLGDIQQQGSDAAFRAAQAQFNQEQGLGLDSQKANQAAGLTYNAQDLERQKAGEASRQFGADLGIRGLNAANTAASTLGGIGSDIYGQNLKTTGAQLAAGTAEQEQGQKVLDQQYTDFKNQEQDPYRRLSFMSDILGGTQGAVKSSFETQPQPSNMQTLAGLGSIFAGLSKAEGGTVRKLSAVDRGLARVAPDSDFADGGIVGYEKGGKTSKEDFAPEEWRGDDSAATVFGGTVLPGKAISATKRAIQDAKILANYGTDAQSVIKPVGKFGKVAGAVGKVAAPVAGGLSLIDTYNTPTEQYDKRFGFEGREPGFVSDTAVRTLGAASDLGNTLTGGLAGKYLFRDMEQEKAPAGPTKAAAAKKDGETDAGKIDPSLYALSGKSSSSGGIGVPNISAGKGTTMDEMRKNLKDAGHDPEGFKREQLEMADKVAAAKKGMLEAEEKDIAARHEKEGIAGLEREKKIQGRLDELPGREKQAEKDAYVNAGLAILMAPPGGKGWRGAIAPIAAGAKLGLGQYRGEQEKLRGQKEKLDDSMDALSEARRQEDIARGKEKAIAKRATRAAEVEAQERTADVLKAAGLEGLATSKTMFSAYQHSYELQKNREFDAAKTKATLGTQIDIANMKTNAAGGFGTLGGKPITQAQYAGELRKYTDQVMKELVNPRTKKAYSQEDAMVEAKRRLDAAIARDSIGSDASGWGLRID